MKRRLIKILLIISSTLVFLLLITAIFISPVTKNYIVKHSKEMVGRKVEIRGLHINLFTGSLEVDSIYIFEKNDKDIFASLDTFFVDITLSKLLTKNLEISELRIVHPYLDILQKGDVFNFDDLMSKNVTKKQDTSNSGFPKSIVIRNIYFRRGKIVYTDQELNNTIEMNDLGVSIPEISFGKGNTKGGVHLKIGNSATLDSKLEINMLNNNYKLNLSVRDLAMSIFKPYIQEYYNVKQLEGTINGNLLLSGNTNHIMDFKVSGTANANKFMMTNSLDEPVASVERASMKMENLFYKNSTYIFDNIHASNVRLNYILHPKNTNFSILFKQEEKNKTTKSSPMTFKIKELHIDNSQLVYLDKTLYSPLTLPVTKIDFLATNFDMNGNNEIKMSGSFPEGGFVNFKWKGNMNDISTQKLSLNLQNLKLKLISPYCTYFTAYEITNGNMNFVSNNNIRNNNIQSTNFVDVFKVNVGKKHKNLKVKYNVPLKLALYILKDKDDKINFDLPVKGNIKDPQFSYKKIIFKTVVNLMVKVALSPVKFLAGSLGLNPDKMESIALIPLQTDLTAEQYTQMNALSTIFKKKPDMVLTLTQFVNLKESIPEYSLYKTKYSYLNSIHADSDSLISPTFDDIQQVSNSDTHFVDYVDSLLNIKGIGNTKASLYEKVNALYLPDSLKTGLFSILEKRNLRLKNYMITNNGIPENNLVIKTADKDTLENYNGKALYKIDLSLPGAEKSTELVSTN